MHHLIGADTQIPNVMHHLIGADTPLPNVMQHLIGADTPIQKVMHHLIGANTPKQKAWTLPHDCCSIRREGLQRGHDRREVAVAESPTRRGTPKSKKYRPLTP